MGISQRGWSIVFTALLVGMSASGAAYAARWGDEGLAVAPDRTHTSYFPQVTEWLKAGVAGGVPARARASMVKTLKAGDDLTAVLAESSAGVILLGAGDFDLTEVTRVGNDRIIRGAGADQTRIRLTRGTGLLLDGVKGVGIEDLELRGPDAEIALAQTCPAPRLYANQPGVPTNSPAAIALRGATNCWVQDCRITGVDSTPLAIEGGSRHITVRGVNITGALNRGVGEGCVRLADVAYLLFCDNAVRGIRQVVLNEPAEYAVFKGCVWGIGVHFSRSRNIRNNLFEDQISLLPPLYPWAPYSKYDAPLGEGNVVVNHRAYHHGSDVVAQGVTNEPGVPYALRTAALHGEMDYLTLGCEPGRFLSRHQSRTRAVTNETLLKGVREASAPLPEPPSGAAVVECRNDAPLDVWLTAGPLPAAAWASPLPADLPSRPVAADASFAIAGTNALFAPIEAGCLIRGKAMTGGDKNNLQGKFGRLIRDPQGAKVNLLKTLGGVWGAVGLLQTQLYVPYDLTAQLELNLVGAEARIWLGGQTLATDGVVKLSAGYHPLLVQYRAQRRAPFEQHATLSLAFKFVDTRPKPMVFDTPAPAGGTLYPVQGVARSGGRELDAAESALRAFRVFRGPSAAGLRTEIETLAAGHDNTVGGDLMAAWLRVLAEAPADETRADVTPEQWADLEEYYAVAGAPERGWAIGKQHDPPKVRVYYDQPAEGGRP